MAAKWLLCAFIPITMNMPYPFTAMCLAKGWNKNDETPANSCNVVTTVNTNTGTVEELLAVIGRLNSYHPPGTGKPWYIYYMTDEQYQKNLFEEKRYEEYKVRNGIVQERVAP